MEKIKENTIVEEIKRRILDNERGLVWITPEKSLETKLIVRNAKKNYASLFNEEFGVNDDRVFWPLIKTHVDSITGNLDYDLSDIKVLSKLSKFKGTAFLASELLRCKLKEGKFGSLFNEAAKELALSGTVVIRTNNNDKLAKAPKSFLVDIENFITDFNDNEPTWFVERVPMNRYSVPKIWNKDVLDKSPATKFKDAGNKVLYDKVIGYRYEGLMPRGWINGTTDEDEVYGLIWMTGLEGQGEPYVQSRRILGKDATKCSYDFAQFVPNQNRFISVGVAEALENLQKYINLVVNNRVQRANLASTGIVQVRKGSGITPKDIKELPQSAAIVVDNIDQDIKFTQVPDVSAVSFNEEASINQSANTLTGSTEASRGQINRGVTLGQANLEANFSGQRFQYHRESLGFMFENILSKWIKMIAENMDEEETVNITSDETLKEVAAEQAKYDHMQIANTMSQRFGDMAGQMAMKNQDVRNELVNQRLSKNEWKLAKESLKDFKYKIEIVINNETKDLNAIAQNIIQALPIVTQLPDGQQLIEPLTNKFFEILGLSRASLK